MECLLFEHCRQPEPHVRADILLKLFHSIVSTTNSSSLIPVKALLKLASAITPAETDGDIAKAGVSNILGTPSGRV